MNIALFASAFYPSFGGVEELCRQLAHAHTAAGHRVIVITERWPRSLPALEKIENIDVYRLPFRVRMPQLRAKIAYQLTRRLTLRRLRQILVSNTIELIHVQCVCSSSRYLHQLKLRGRLPLVVSLQGELTMDAGGLYQRSTDARLAMRNALNDADIITACSLQTLEEARDFMGGSLPTHSCVISNGILLSDFESGKAYVHPKPYILAIGRHVAQKGFDVLLKAMGVLASEGTPAHDLILAGDGPEFPHLRVLTRDLGIEQQVHFVGRVDHTTAVSLFLGCAFFVLPSRLEPFGIVNLEAMASGKAVIASAVGGVSEIVQDRITGLLVPPENIVELAEAIRMLIENEPFRNQLGENGADRATKFDWRAISNEYLLEYKAAIKLSAKRLPTLSPV